MGIVKTKQVIFVVFPKKRKRYKREKKDKFKWNFEVTSTGSLFPERNYHVW